MRTKETYNEKYAKLKFHPPYKTRYKMFLDILSHIGSGHNYPYYIREYFKETTVLAFTLFGYGSKYLFSITFFSPMEFLFLVVIYSICLNVFTINIWILFILPHHLTIKYNRKKQILSAFSDKISIDENTPIQVFPYGAIGVGNLKNMSDAQKLVYNFFVDFPPNDQIYKFLINTLPNHQINKISQEEFKNNINRNKVNPNNFHRFHEYSYNKSKDMLKTEKEEMENKFKLIEEKRLQAINSEKEFKKSQIREKIKENAIWGIIGSVIWVIFYAVYIHDLPFILTNWYYFIIITLIFLVPHVIYHIMPEIHAIKIKHLQAISDFPEYDIYKTLIKQYDQLIKIS